MQAIDRSSPLAPQGPLERKLPSALALSALFALFYFVQGICEPTAGLMHQPVLSLLKSWGQSPGQIGAFAGLLALPWALKPVYGLMSDFFPLAGYHRKSYLILVSGLASAAMLVLYAAGPATGAVATMLWLLWIATLGVAFSDVVVDALMVEQGQPRNLTGRLQSAQWGAIYAASILSGYLGGYFSGRNLERQSMLICGMLMLVTLAAAAWAVSDRGAQMSKGELRRTLAALRRAAASRTILAVGAFLFLWNFNPFLNSIAYLYMTDGLKMSEEFFGYTESLLAVGAMVGSFSYGAYCRRWPMRRLIHLSIMMGIVSMLAYWGLRGPTSAQIVVVVAGFALATGTVIQLDLAAQVCPPQAAGTLFALLMALSNLGTAVSDALGGWCYGATSAEWGKTHSFQFLVGIGALFTAGCWLIVPWLKIPQPPTAQRHS